MDLGVGAFELEQEVEQPYRSIFFFCCFITRKPNDE